VDPSLLTSQPPSTSNSGRSSSSNSGKGKGGKGGKRSRTSSSESSDSYTPEEETDEDKEFVRDDEEDEDEDGFEEEDDDDDGGKRRRGKKQKKKARSSGRSVKRRRISSSDITAAKKFVSGSLTTSPDDPEGKIKLHKGQRRDLFISLKDPLFEATFLFRLAIGFGRGKTPKDVQFIMEAYAMSPEILAKCMEGLFVLCHTPGLCINKKRKRKEDWTRTTFLHDRALGGGQGE